MNVRLRVFLVFAAGLALGLAAQAQAADYTTVLDSGTKDRGSAVATDSFGNAYLAGSTQGSLGGPNAGDWDAFLSKIDGAGNILWTRQFGTSEESYGNGVATDASSNVYITGYTTGDLGEANAGSEDAFLVKYNSAGNFGWSRLLGTPALERSYAACTDSAGNVYITGSTWGVLGAANAGQSDVFLSKYDSAGNPVWTRQLGTSSQEQGYAVTADLSGNIYLSGGTGGVLQGTNAGSQDAFLSKYDSAGNFVWTRQFGTSEGDAGRGVVTDAAGNIYVTGYTNQRVVPYVLWGEDIFLRKYDGSGGLLWARAIATTDWEGGYGVTIDASGNICIAGFTTGDLGDPNTKGGRNVLLVSYDDGGAFLGARQFDLGDSDNGTGVAADALGNVFISATSGMPIPYTILYEQDAFLIQVSEIPEPATVCLLGLGVVALIVRRRSTKLAAGKRR